MGPCVSTDGGNLAVCIFNVFTTNLYKTIDGRGKCWVLGSAVLFLQSNNMAKYSLMSRFREDSSQLKGKEKIVCGGWGGGKSLII